MTCAFDYSLDEAVDANSRFIRGSPVARAARRRSIWSAGAAFAVAVFATAALRAPASMTTNAPVVALTALTLGCAFAGVYAVLYDWSIRRRVRRFLREQVTGTNALHCEIELRPDGAWVRQPYAEILFDWSDAVAVVDAGDAIELHFRMGLVLARDRAFATSADRAAFLDRARTLAAGPETSAL